MKSQLWSAVIIFVDRVQVNCSGELPIRQGELWQALLRSTVVETECEAGFAVDGSKESDEFQRSVVLNGESVHASVRIRSKLEVLVTLMSGRSRGVMCYEVSGATDRLGISVSVALSIDGAPAESAAEQHIGDWLRAEQFAILQRAILGARASAREREVLLI